MKRHEQYVDKIYDWCTKEYGFSRFQSDYPTISTSYQGKKNSGYFLQDENHIHVYLNMHEFLTELIDTIIHEWTHYLQSPIWLSRYNKSRDYSDNPYEIEAFAVAKRDTMSCFHDILKD